ncbi:MAG TPA: hypothetical protein GXX18_05955 [Bacillales bacterium]|nr:hypothetical protein [Bacillales bacterium]
MKQFFMLFILLFLLAGCAELNINLKENGSGTAVLKVASGGFITPTELENEINSQISKQNNAGKEVMKLKSVKKKGEYIEAELSFKSISALDESALYVTVKDLERFAPNKIDNLRTLDGKEFNLDKIKTYPVISFNKLDQVITTIQLPSNIIAISGDVSEGKSKREAIIQSNSATIVFEPASNFSFGLLFFLLAVISGGWLFYKKLKSNKSSTPHVLEGAKEE